MSVFSRLKMLFFNIVYIFVIRFEKIFSGIIVLVEVLTRNFIVFLYIFIPIKREKKVIEIYEVIIQNRVIFLFLFYLNHFKFKSY